jgi:uncharacterized protein YndB with AHSA1/START domain
VDDQLREAGLMQFSGANQSEPASTRPAAPELCISRVIDAPRELVFKAWTDPDHARNWWGPRNWPAAHLEMDVREGGAWRNCLRSTETGKELWQKGVVREVVAPERLVFTFSWEEEGERGLETLVTVTFADEGGRTRLTFRQTPFQSLEERDGHRSGWNSSFDRLEESLGRAPVRASSR